jgi:allantoicase
VIVKLGFPGSIAGFDIDTTYFTGDYAQYASVDACFLPEDQASKVSDATTEWTEILPKVSLQQHSPHLFGLSDVGKVYTHVRLRIYPDGGVARFRVYGSVEPAWPENIHQQQVDLAFVGHGGRVVAASNEFGGSSNNLVLPGRGMNVADGWETKRASGTGHADWVIVKLGAAGHLEKAEVDTNHFKGNFPDSIELHACNTTKDDPSRDANVAWFQLLGEQKISGHTQNVFHVDAADRVFTHVKITIHPDGGVQRLRLYGRKAAEVVPAEPLTVTTEEAVQVKVKKEVVEEVAPVVAEEEEDASRSIKPSTATTPGAKKKRKEGSGFAMDTDDQLSQTSSVGGKKKRGTKA